jgi:hypothetical protein
VAPWHTIPGFKDALPGIAAKDEVEVEVTRLVDKASLRSLVVGSRQPRKFAGIEVGGLNGCQDFVLLCSLQWHANRLQNAPN